MTLDFEAKKKTLANEFEANISTKLECLSRKTDFYPHELDELRLSLNDMYTRTRDARTSLIHIDYGNGNTFLLENDNSFQPPKILVQTKPNIELTLNSYYHRQFQIHFNNLTHLHFDNSDKHVKPNLCLYNHQQHSICCLFSYSFAIAKQIVSNYSITKNVSAEVFGPMIHQS